SAKGAFYPAVDVEDSIGHIGLNSRNSELQNVKTIIHELAHAKLHSGKKVYRCLVKKKSFKLKWSLIQLHLISILIRLITLYSTLQTGHKGKNLKIKQSC